MTTSLTSLTVCEGKHLCGLSVELNSEGRSITVQSPWIPSVPVIKSDSSDELSKQLIDRIKQVMWRSITFSSKRVNHDELADKCYCDIDADKYIVTSIIKGSDGIHRFPYNNVQHHIDNKWMMRCLNIYYRLSNNHINNSCHTYSKVFKIKRSSGQICDAKIFDEAQIRVRKSSFKKDEEITFYLRPNFFDDGSPIKDTAPKYDSCIWMHKDYRLDDVSEQNNISEMSITFNDIFTDEELDNVLDDPVKHTTMSHFNNLHNVWINDHLKPAISRMSNITITLVE